MTARLRELTIEVTQKCPNACLFCSSLASVTSDVCLNATDVRRVAFEAAGLGLQEVSVSGGEPLCHPCAASIVDDLHVAGLDVSFYTSGLKMEKGSVEPFVAWNRFSKNRTRVVFNIQSTDPRVHDTLVGRQGALDLTRHSLSAALSAGMKVEVHMVPNRVNLPTIEASVGELAEWGVHRVSFLRMVYQGCARAHLQVLRLDTDDQQRLRAILKRLSAGVPRCLELRFGIPFSAYISRPMCCTAGNEKLIVRYDGKVLPCEAFKDAGDGFFVLGDIRHDTLAEMLGRAKQNEMLSSLRHTVCDSEPCPAQILNSVCRQPVGGSHDHVEV